MMRTRTILALTACVLAEGCSPPVPAPTADRMKLELIGKQVFDNPVISVAGIPNEFTQFTPQEVGSSADSKRYNVTLGFNVQDYGVCTGVIVIGYTKSNSGWVFANSTIAEQPSCPAHEEQVRQQQQAQQAQAQAAQAQAAEQRRLQAIDTHFVNCWNNNLECADLAGDARDYSNYYKSYKESFFRQYNITPAAIAEREHRFGPLPE